VEWKHIKQTDVKLRYLLSWQIWLFVMTKCW